MKRPAGHIAQPAAFPKGCTAPPPHATQAAIPEAFEYVPGVQGEQGAPLLDAVPGVHKSQLLWSALGAEPSVQLLQLWSRPAAAQRPAEQARQAVSFVRYRPAAHTSQPEVPEDGCTEPGGQGAQLAAPGKAAKVPGEHDLHMAPLNAARPAAHRPQSVCPFTGS